MHAIQMRKEDQLEWEALALGFVKTELDIFTNISMNLAKSFGFLQSRVKSEFPKTCRKCGKCYHSFEEFYYGTDPIERGTVSYPTLGAEFYLHRNCKDNCGSTLVVIFNDRRDESELGFQRRVVFQKCLDILKDKMDLAEPAARDVLFSLLKQRIQG
ncbi:MAG: hypothetical protein EOP10_14470 [Proteobacteria bacterium]|nr:MAG: hypothetical protein EOP10_14470 [Pseudomonadota bacterium]